MLATNFTLSTYLEVYIHTYICGKFDEHSQISVNMAHSTRLATILTPISHSQRILPMGFESLYTYLYLWQV